MSSEAKLVYKKGDLFEHLPEDKKVMIAHVCNNKGAWGSGFVLAVDRYSDIPRAKYLGDWENMKNSYHGSAKKLAGLGYTSFAYVDDDNVVANMIAQNGFKNSKNPVPLNYVALLECMRQVRLACTRKKAPKEIYCPKFGSDRAGGNWEVIETFIQQLWVDKGINVTVFEL